MQARLAPQSDAEAARIAEAGLRPERTYALDELCGADAWLFLTAVTPVDLGPGGRLPPGRSWGVGPDWEAPLTPAPRSAARRSGT